MDTSLSESASFEPILENDWLKCLLTSAHCLHVYMLTNVFFGSVTPIYRSEQNGNS